MSTRIEGCVKWFHPKKGFGFISGLDDGSDVYVHQSNLVVSDGVFRHLKDGEYVSYSVETGDDGKTQATSVMGIRDGDLMCTRLYQRKQEYLSRSANSGGDVSVSVA